GMIIEIDHFPQWSYQRAFEILEENDYPAAGTHGRDGNGRIYAIGGISKINLGRCQDSDNPGSTLDELRNEVDLITTMGGYPAVGFGFDLNGFAGAPGPRFGDDGCSSEQGNETVYPFTSYAGDITFTQPNLGARAVDFDTEGMLHIGLLPELLEDARKDAVSEDDLEPLFRSAEGYIRMWEKAEERAAELRGG
ncbi:MAG: microsomal dipeptidase-like Zn-dependent dipeptidase, partial [Myxococcota bacterium]